MRRLSEENQLRPFDSNPDLTQHPVIFCLDLNAVPEQIKIGLWDRYPGPQGPARRHPLLGPGWFFQG